MAFASKEWVKDLMKKCFEKKSGYSQSTIETSKTLVINRVEKLGNTVCINLKSDTMSFTAGEVIGTIPIEYRPNANTPTVIGCNPDNNVLYPIDINTNGNITVWKNSNGSVFRFSATYFTTD